MIETTLITETIYITKVKLELKDLEGICRGETVTKENISMWVNYEIANSGIIFSVNYSVPKYQIVLGRETIASLFNRVLPYVEIEYEHRFENGDKIIHKIQININDGE